MSPQDRPTTLLPEGARFSLSPHGDESIPLARALKNRFPELNWGDVRRLCERGRVLVGGVPASDARRTIRPGSKVEILAPGAKRRAHNKGSLVTIRYEDEHIVVVEKPPGVAVGYGEGVKGKESPGDTMVNRLRKALAERGERDPNSSLFAAYRLDKDVSGLLLFTRNERAREGIGHQIRRRQLERSFLVGVQGAPKEDEGALTSGAGPDRSRRSRGGQTHYEVVERLGKASILRCKLDKARVTDLRVQLSEAGFPILGESLYLRGNEATIPSNRLIMHGDRLVFRHPTRSRKMTFESRLPREINAFLRGVGSKDIAGNAPLAVPDWARRPRGEGRVKSMKELLEVAAEIPDWDGAGAPPGLERDLKVDPDGFYTVAKKGSGHRGRHGRKAQGSGRGDERGRGRDDIPRGPWAAVPRSGGRGSSGGGGEKGPWASRGGRGAPGGDKPWESPRGSKRGRDNSSTRGSGKAPGKPGLKKSNRRVKVRPPKKPE